ncbi:hypothetical protein HPB52_002792 [Rhipicephalus sanguineus]|uniref:Uncharacterized protein n=1 Tax=Rhipicephalus sanguineus TaxID=34632 RepID=A0A9D4T4Y5_RHISA|nr:hypothetical protein HPB52_002792 [Rhipicephalus sanguineus]
MCGGNDTLDARAVTAALTHIVKEKALPSKDMGIRDENIEEDDVIEELEALREPPRKPPNSVAYSGLVYVDGYIAKLITDVGHSALVKFTRWRGKNSFLSKACFEEVALAGIDRCLKLTARERRDREWRHSTTPSLSSFGEDNRRRF